MKPMRVVYAVEEDERQLMEDALVQYSAYVRRELMLLPPEELEKINRWSSKLSHADPRAMRLTADAQACEEALQCLKSASGMDAPGDCMHFVLPAWTHTAICLALKKMFDGMQRPKFNGVDFGPGEDQEHLRFFSLEHMLHKFATRELRNRLLKEGE